MTISSLLRRAFLVQALVLALGVLVVSGSLLRYRTLDLRQRELAATIEGLESLRATVFSAETGLRGYVLVGRESFLDPYDAAASDIAAQLSVLGGGSWAGDGRLARVGRLIDGWRTDFAEVVLDHLADDHRRRADELLQSGEGKARIDAIRLLIADLIDDTAALRTADSQEADRLAVVIALAVVGVCAALAMSAAGVDRVLRRQLGRPLGALAATAARIGDGDLTARAEEAGTEEVARSARAFNDMAAHLQVTVEQLRSLDRMKSELMSVVSHELRTPLTSIRGSLGLLAAGAYGTIEPDAHEMLAIASSNTDRLVRLINDILDLERMESGRAALELVACPVDGLVAAAVAATAGTARAADVELMAPPSGAGDVVADHDRIVQTLTNLLGNAVKFSVPGGRVVVDVLGTGAEVGIRVTDHGRGIPADRLDRIFERFEQVDASDSRDRGGTGLGLPIAQRIAEQHQGRIEVTSEVGVGSAFVLWLPAVGPTAPTDAGPDDAARRCIVVVEDDADLAQVLASALGHQGLRVAMAAGAAEAIELAERVHPDLLVLDVGLADGDGYEVVARLRRDDHLHDAPVVVFTGRDLDDADRVRLRLGPTEFLVKGHADVAAVEERVLSALGRQPLPAGAAP